MGGFQGNRERVPGDATNNRRSPGEPGESPLEEEERQQEEGEGN